MYFLIKLNIYLLCIPSISCLDIYPREVKSMFTLIPACICIPSDNLGMNLYRGCQKVQII